MILSIRFLLIYRLAVSRKALVADYFRKEGSAIFWDIQLRRALQDWELGQFMELMENIYSFKEVGTGEDGMVWCGEPRGIFSVSSFYKFLFSKDRSGFPWQSIWIPGVPTKVAFFVWLAALDWVLTIDNQIRQRHVLVNWCCMC